MSTLFIVVLLLVACCLAFFRSNKACIIISLATLLSFILVGDGLLSLLLLKPLQNHPIILQPNWSKRNAIVVLGGGAIKLHQADTDIVRPTIISYSRILEAGRLYLSCKNLTRVCTVIVSGGDALATGKSEAMVFRDELLSLGIKDADIKVEQESMNTYKNAEYTSLLLHREQYDRVFLVTSGIHLNRALLYFSHFGVDATAAPSDYLEAKVSFFPLGYNFATTDFALHEYAGIVRFHVYNFLGWNKNVSRPGAL